MQCTLSARPLLLSTLVFCAACVNAQTPEQRLDLVIAKYSEKPSQVSVAVPAQAQMAVARPTATAATDALREAGSVCVSQGGTAMESRIVKNGSVKFIKSLKCAQADGALWYLDVEEHKVEAPKVFSGNVLALNVSFSLKRLLPSDPPQTPVLSWRGVHKVDGDLDEVAVDGMQGTKFGFRYAWRFKAQPVQRLELVWRPVVPQGVKPPAEFRRPLDVRDDCVEPRLCDAAWTFEAPQEWTPGVWNLGLAADGLPIVSTVFVVRKP